MSKLRLLWSSNIMFCSSGYGVQSASILPRLAELPEFGGRDAIAQFAWYGLSGATQTLGGFKIYPAGVDPYGNDVIGAHTRDFDANLVITLIDAWVLKNTAEQIKPALFCPWLPIDHDPVPDAVLDSIQGAHMPITYAKWGHELLTKAGVKNTYIPHGIEPTIYTVNPAVDTVRKFKAEVMKCTGHLSVIVAANKGYPDRKAFQVQVRAWAEFAKDKPDARLYIHTEQTPMYGGIDFAQLIRRLDIGDKVFFPDRYGYYRGFPPEYLAMVYNAADVLLANSMSEGFGIPLIEAQACGTPVITTDFSAMPELVRCGHIITPADMFWTPMGSWQAWPDVHGIVDALNEQYAQWEQTKGWSMAQRLRTAAQIHGEYSWDNIVKEYWAPFIAQIAGEAPPTRASQQAAPPMPIVTDEQIKRIASKPRGKITSVAMNGERSEKVAA